MPETPQPEPKDLEQNLEPDELAPDQMDEIVGGVFDPYILFQSPRPTLHQ